MKKIIKNICIVILFLFIVWIIIFTINFIKSNKLDRPILMKPIYIREIGLYKNSNGETGGYNPISYQGLGYKIDSKVETQDESVIENKMYLFGILINETSVNK